MKHIPITIFILFFSYSTNAQSGDVESIENALSNRNDLVFYGSFDEGFNTSAWECNWGIRWDNRASTCEVTPGSFNDSYAQFDGFVLAKNRVGVYKE
jgi:hypothetical protein